MSSEISERYAQALFELAFDENTVKETKQQAESILQLTEDTPELLDFFRAVKVTKEEKKDLINRVFSDAYDQYMVSFMKLLIDKGRMDYLKEILRVLIQKANEELGIQEAVVYSARKLDDEAMAKIKGALEKKTGKEIVLKNQIDEQLIAGIKVVVGNNITDVSMKRRIEGMKEALLRGGQV
jgi:F-type H+-transporting ATPase subunit delta